MQLILLQSNKLLTHFRINSIVYACSVVVYYLRSKSLARIAMVKLLKEMLYLEAKDKEFLLTNITRVTQGKGMSTDDELNSTSISNGRA